MEGYLKELMKAVQKNNLVHVEEVLERVETTKEGGSVSGCKEPVKVLVNSLCSTSGDSLCHVAAQHGYVDILRYLIEDKGAKVDIRNRDRKTPLHNAAQFSQLDCIKYLLNKGADVNAIKQADWTPLMLACTKPNEDAVALLLEAGADPFYKNKDGWNSFHIACRTGNVKIVQFLVQSLSTESPRLLSLLCDSRSRNGRKPLHTAALHGNLEVAAYITANALNDVNEVDNCGSTPLMDACRSGSTEMVDLIVRCGGDLKAINKTGYNCLHVAAEAGLPNMIEHLVKNYNFTVDEPSAGQGLTPLQVATKVMPTNFF